MKFYKRLPINRKDPMSKTFAVETDGRIVTNTSNSLQTPVGTAAQRPTVPVDGQLRYNTDIGVGGELEAYVNGTWEIIKTNRQANITKQEFDNGDYADTFFGPLTYDVDVAKPENVFVYVENVPQIAGINFSLDYSSISTPITTSTIITQNETGGITVIRVASVADFNPGNPIAGINLTGNTIVDTSATDLTITITPGTYGPISIDDVVATQLPVGTYVRFSSDSLPVPHKPVITLLGFDGYNPPFEV
jgi:hypothetical protein